jgi:hypothetical protein
MKITKDSSISNLYVIIFLAISILSYISQAKPKRFQKNNPNTVILKIYHVIIKKEGYKNLRYKFLWIKIIIIVGLLIENLDKERKRNVKNRKQEKDKEMIIKF